MVRSNVIALMTGCLVVIPLACGKKTAPDTSDDLPIRRTRESSAAPSSSAGALSHVAAGAASASGAPARAASQPTPPPGMVYVPPGSFTMGSNDGAKNAKPAHKVTLTKGFFLDITEVSVGQYALCVQHTACTPANAATGPREYAAEWTPCCTANDPEKKDYPITCIDQAQAIAYCRFAAKRLPTEAEWEYAARGPDSHIYPWGDDEPAASHAHFGHGSKTCGKQTGPRQVGSIPAGKGPFGTLDQAGNVWEWTSDTYGTPYTADDQVDPIFKKPSDSFTVRGGSWDFSAPSLRSFARLGMKPTERTVSLGVRCAKNAE